MSDGQTLASGSQDETIKLWNLKTGDLLRTLTGHKGSVRSVAISADGQTLASGSLDQTIKLWKKQ
jgi:WD40 repeat protein